MSWRGFCTYRGNDSGFSNGSSLAVGTIKENLIVGAFEQERLKEKSIFGIIRENMMGDGLRREN